MKTIDRIEFLMYNIQYTTAVMKGAQQMLGALFDAAIETVDFVLDNLINFFVEHRIGK